ncbi:MAG: hypothetical protein OEY34_06815 [Cyclobacteriaceae bacterium]|nr:hypothetical protein [Cyclobacteriaceae bacterium]
MKKIGLIVLMLAALNTFGQDMGIGIRGGDLNGITFKKYSSANDIEISLGNASYFYSNNTLTNNLFNDWINKNYTYSNFELLGVRKSSAVAAHFRMLFHKNLDKIGTENVKGLVWYYGIGAQIRSRKINYDYRYKFNSTDPWSYALGENIRDIDLGGEGILGLEYTFAEVPLSLFLDINLFVEIVDNPLAFWFQGGSGIRYRF